MGKDIDSSVGCLEAFQELRRSWEIHHQEEQLEVTADGRQAGTM